MRTYIEGYALRRSGCHAILNWIFNQYEEPVLFFNNAIRGQDPLLNIRSSGDLQNILDIEPWYHNRQSREEIASWDTKTISILYEDYVTIGPELAADVSWIKPDKIHRLLIFRDFPNWMASRIRWTLNRKMKMDYELFIWRWKMYAYDFLYKEGLIKICYNLWRISTEYRESILSELDLPLRNDDISHIPNFGGGSSFTPVSYGARARCDLQYNSRHKYLEEFPEVQELIAKDEELYHYIKAVERSLWQ